MRCLLEFSIGKLNKLMLSIKYGRTTILNLDDRENLAVAAYYD